MKSKIGYYIAAVLFGGLVALFGPWLLLHPEVSLPHWLSFLAFGLVGGSARLARTVGERRGVLLAAAGVVLSSVSLCWGTELLMDASAHNQWSRLALHYFAPLVTLSFAVPCATVVVARRLLRHETPADS